MKLKDNAADVARSLGQKLKGKTKRLCYNVVIWPFEYVIFALMALLERSFRKAKTTGERLLLVFVLFVSLLWISVISYASFYNLYLPTAEVSRPVHLSFSVCSEGVGICSFPSANVSFTENSPIKEVLGSGQIYRVIIDIEIPDNPVNRDLGMFMVVLRMFDRTYHVSTSSMRPALFKYKSMPMRLLSLAVLSPLYFSGFYEEKQTISLEMFSTFTDDFYHPSVGAYVEIQNHKIQLYSCHLKLYAKFSGLKYILYYWPITSAIFGITSNLCFFVLFFTIAFFNKRETLRRVKQSLSSESLRVDDAPQIADKKKKSMDTIENEKKFNQSTQTRSKEEDDIETYDLPLVQEPADFGDDFDDKDLELVAELRHRRVQ